MQRDEVAGSTTKKSCSSKAGVTDTIAARTLALSRRARDYTCAEAGRVKGKEIGRSRLKERKLEENDR